MTNKDNIWLVAHDFSSCADAAADLALDDLLDSRRGGHIVLVNVFTIMLPQGTIEAMPASSWSVGVEEATRLQVTRGLMQVVARLQARVQADHPQAVVDIAISARLGTPVEGLLEEAAAQNATRIFVGTHGRKGIGHFLLGSVAERVARLSKIPVLVAHDMTKKKERSL